jgi:GTPase SAR1 family protein
VWPRLHVADAVDDRQSPAQGGCPGRDRDIELQIWDTASHEQLAPMVLMYARGAQAGIVVEPVSLQNVRVWKGRLLEGEPNTFVALAINKIDLTTEAAVATRIQDELSDNFPHIMFTFACSGDGVNELFAIVAEYVVPTVPHQSIPTTQVNNDLRKCC